MFIRMIVESISTKLMISGKKDKYEYGGYVILSLNELINNIPVSACFEFFTRENDDFEKVGAISYNSYLVTSEGTTQFTVSALPLHDSAIRELFADIVNEVEAKYKDKVYSEDLNFINDNTEDSSIGE